MASDVSIELGVDVEVHSDELEIEVGETDTAEAELHSDGLEITIEAHIERAPTEAYEEPEFDDAATEETVADMESDIDTLQQPADEA